MMRRLAIRNKMLGAIAGVFLLALVAVAAVQTSRKLFPDWSNPTAGTYDKPAGEMGKKATAQQPWSVTTITSSIMGKPVKGTPVSIVGEIIDLSCYMQVGKHGDKHRDCGQKCARNGQPVGLLAKDGTIYTLIDEEHDPRRDGLTEFRKQAVEHMAHVMLVHGTLTEVEGQRAIYVQGTVKK